MRPPFAKSLAAALAAVLVVVSPGPGVYSAFAAQPSGTSGLPSGAGWAPRLQTMASQAARHDGARRRGVDVGEILRALSSIDLRSPAGRIAAAPIFERLAAKPGAADEDVLDALAAAAAEQRAAVAALTGRIDAGAGLADAPALSEALRRARRHDVLLGRADRERLLSRAFAYSTRLEDAREAQAAATIRQAVDAWRPAALESAPVAATGTLDVRRSGLAPVTRLRPAAKPAPDLRPMVLPAYRRHAPSKLSIGLQLGGYAGLAALAVIGLAQLAPAAALAAGVASSILLHEQAHLLLLRHFGDDTAEREGVRSALNLISLPTTVALPLATAWLTSLLSGPLVLVGWAKPIPVDFNRLRLPQKHAGIVALGGVVKNAALAALFAGLAAALPESAATGTLLLLAKINVALAAFNLVPLPHLDGGKALVALMPASWYARWTHNGKIPDQYQKTFQKLYDGPSALLNMLSLTGQRSVNLLALGVTVTLFAALSAAGWWFLGLPVALMVLLCSYDYYCIREKIQNENAVNELIGIVSGFASELKAELKADRKVKSKVNTEEVEHALKNALEDMVDKAVDSEGFAELSDDAKWERFREFYLESAVALLKRKGMTQDDPETIRRVLTGAAGRKYLQNLRGWIERTDVWKKWHSPGRKAARAKPQETPSEKSRSMGGGATTALLALTAVGAGLLAATGVMPDATAIAAAGGGALMAGTLREVATPKPALKLEELVQDANANLDAKQQKLLLNLLTDMRGLKRAEIVGRAEEANKVVDTVTGPRGFPNSVILVGKAGTGKTATIEKIAQGLSDGTFPNEKMEGRHLFSLNRRKLLREQDPLASFDELIDALRKLNEESEASGNKVVLVIDEVHELFKNHKTAGVPDLIKEAMTNGDSAIVLATTLDEFKQYIEKDEGFTRRAIPIMIEEATSAETQRMLEAAQDHYERSYGLEIEPAALTTANEESRHDQKVYLPGRAFKYLNAAAKTADFKGQRGRLGQRIKDKISQLRYAMGRLSEELARTDLVTDGIKKDDPEVVDLYNAVAKLADELVSLYRRRDAVPSSGTPKLTADMVAAEIEFETGVSVARGKPDLAKKILTAAANLKKRVIGQDQAVDAIVAALEESQAGVKPDPNSPIGVFYLTGPTGSGKTHLARELARELFDDPDAMIRLDMTEYMERHTVSQFKGSPPGYVGFDQGGQLTEKVRRKPYSIILFDEVEKAHPDVWLLMLQIMGEGRLTDGQGRLVDFKNTLILMSSNLGMHAVDVGAYAARFAELQAQQRDAAARGDEAAVAMLQKQKQALADEAAAATKARAQEVTAQAFKEVYAPEFRGRLTADPIVFNRVTPDMASEIAGLNLGELKSILARAGHGLTWTPGVTELVVNEGYSLDLGARPIKNALRRLITQPLAKSVLASIVANGGQAAGMDIALAAEKGAVKFVITPRKREAAKRSEPGDGAAQEAFGRLLSASLKKAANAGELPGVDAMDSWFKEAVAGYAAPAAAPSASAKPPEAPAPSRPSTPAPAPSLLETAPAPAMLSPRAVTAEHNLHDAKDDRLQSAADELGALLERAGYPQAQRDVVLRDIEDPADPYVGFLEVFVEQAKKMAGAQNAPISLSFEAGDAARIVLRRAGTLGDKERSLLETHFSGPVPASSQAARDKAEGLNVRNQDGRRLMLDLYRKLSAIPGARLGASQTDAGVEYWLELPGPPKPAPVEDASPPAEQAQAGPAPEAEEASSPAAAGPTKAKFRRIDSLPEDAASAPGAEGLVWVEFKPIRVSPSRRLVEKTLKPLVEGAGLTYVDFENQGALTRVLARAANAPAALLAARSLTNRVPTVKRVLIHPSVARRGPVGLPPALPSRPNQPRRSPRAPAADPDAAIYAKIETQTLYAVDEDAETMIWLTLPLNPLGSKYQLDNYVKVILERERMDLTTSIEDKAAKTLRVRAQAASAKKAGEAAFVLAEDPQVKAVVVHPDARPFAKRRPKFSLSPRVTGAVGAIRTELPAPAVAKIKKFAVALLAQGDQRSPSARLAAADLLAAASTPADLAQARAWLADAEMHNSWARVVAGAGIVARHGDQADEALLLKALGTLTITKRYDGHLYNPVKRRVTLALAVLLEKVDAAALMRRYKEEKTKAGGNHSGVVSEERYSAYHNEWVERALYAALTRKAGPEALGLLLEEWEIDRAPDLFAYLKRVDPARLRALHAAWKASPSTIPAGLERQLTPLAVAEYGDGEDAVRLFDQVAAGWEANVDRGNAAPISEALGRMLARTGAFAQIAETTRKALRSRLNNDFDFARLTASLFAASSAGGEEQLEQIWEVMAANPQNVNPMHEMTQQDAAEGWGRLLHRLGLVESNLTETRQTDTGGHSALPLLQAMLVDPNPLFNKAAMEALRLSLLEGSVKPDAPAPVKSARPIEAQWLIREGPAAVAGLIYNHAYIRLDDAANEDSRLDLKAMPTDRRKLAELWAKRFAKLMEALLGVPFAAEARVYSKKGRDEKTIIWVLRQASGALPTKTAVAQAADVIAELVLISQQSRGPARLAQLAAQWGNGLEDPEGLVNLIGRVQAQGLKLGLVAAAVKPGEAEEAVELWLRIDPPQGPLRDEEREAAEERARARRHAHRLYDAGETDPLTGRPWGQ